MNFISQLNSKYTIQELVKNKKKDISMNIAELRRKISILVIDDEELPNFEYLQRNGFYITHKKDIDTINDVAAYDVILCDIRGVGVNLGSPKEGAFIIKEIRATYPNKQIVAYTGSSYDAEYNSFLANADAVLNKGASLDDWVDILDEQIKKAINIEFQWSRIRTALFIEGLSTVEVAEIESQYVKASSKNKLNNFSSFIDKLKDSKAKELLFEFAASLATKLLSGGIL